jgi:hypothetical protein
MAHKVIPTANKGTVNQSTDMKLQQTTEITKGEAAVTQVDSNHTNYPWQPAIPFYRQRHTSKQEQHPYHRSQHGTLKAGSGTLIIGHSTLKAGSGTLSSQRRQQVAVAQPQGIVTAARS